MHPFLFFLIGKITSGSVTVAFFLIFLKSAWEIFEFKNDKIKITKLAQGLPVGGEIEQLDDGTLFSAFKNRVPVTD